MLKNAYLIAKIGADTAENEQHFAEILPKRRSSRRSGRSGAAGGHAPAGGAGAARGGAGAGGGGA